MLMEVPYKVEEHSKTLTEPKAVPPNLTPTVSSRHNHCSMAGAADGVQYLRDMCITLCYFLQAYPSGSQLLLQGQASIVTHLTTLHDDLIPQVAKCGAAALQHQQSQAEQVRPLLYLLLLSICHAEAHSAMPAQCTVCVSVSLLVTVARYRPVNLSGCRLCKHWLAMLCWADIEFDFQAAVNTDNSVVLTIPVGRS